MMLIKKTKSRAQGHFGFLTAVWSPNNDLWENGLIQFFLRKDQKSTRHCKKQTRELSQPQNMHMNLLTITFLAI